MKSTKTALTIAVGTAFAATAVLAPAAHAADNPFAQHKLMAGYQLAQADTKMKEGDAKMKEGAAKMQDGKCGGDKKMRLRPHTWAKILSS